MPAVAEAMPDMVPVPLEGLVGDAPLPFALYLPTGRGRLVLYRDIRTNFGHDQLSRLRQEGVPTLYIHAADRHQYSRRIEAALDTILRDKSVPLQRRGLVLYGVAVEVANDLLAARPGQEDLRRAEHILASTSSLVLREPLGFRALRQSLAAAPLLAQHSLNVGLLSLGLARHVLGAEPQTLVRAGLAGLLHDVGRVGNLDLPHEDDREHGERGHAELVRLGLPRDVCDAALHHHERHDGRGFPSGLAGERIPEMSRVVAIVNRFDQAYSAGKEQDPGFSTFAALRCLAREHQGAYDEGLAVLLVQLFR